jgi:aminoglycoside phosphotransferase (APT) family kinase protein
MSISDQQPETHIKPSLAQDNDGLENGDEPNQPDVTSDSSSVVYDHEPFDSFRTKLLNFAVTLWDDVDPVDLKVSRMSGGGFNRIIGISRKTPEQEKSLDYILRIPRFDAARLDRDVAALQYVQKLGIIPAPEVIAFDETSDNKLGDPYMIQKRLPGTDLLSSFPELDQSRKCQVAAELGQVLNCMLSKKSIIAGRLILPANVTSSEDKDDEVSVEPLFQPEHPMTNLLESNLTTRDLLSRIFKERKVEGLRRIPSDTLRPQLMDHFTAMASDMHEDGWFAGNDISLCHLDFEPRNILIDTTRDTTQSIISGILDWDSAVLAPSFMSCAPPLWIWAWTDDEEEDERTANNVPPTEEERILKKTFEEAAGPEFMHYAYPSTYRLARRLVRFAIDGIRSSEDVDEAEAMLKEWEEVRAGSKVATA